MSVDTMSLSAMNSSKTCGRGEASSLRCGSQVLPPREEYYDPAREDVGVPDHLVGQREGMNPSPSFQGTYTSDFRERPSMLSEGFPDDMRPEARTEMPAMDHGSALDQHFPGNNPTMPTGAVQYVGRDEPEQYGRMGGPTRYPADTVVDDAFIAQREAEGGTWYDDELSPSPPGRG